MDPYLEDSTLWPGVHDALIATTAAILNRTLPGQYVADTGERLYVAESSRSSYPETTVREFASPPATAGRGAATAVLERGGGTAVVERSVPPWVIALEPVRIRETFVRILSVRQAGRVVAVIEYLSPTNKLAGSEGQQLYRTKQAELLDSDVHLLEIDLLRGGEHMVAAPYPLLVERGAWEYLACLHRGGEGQRYEVWPIRLQERLCAVRVPLTKPDADLVLDLQEAMDRAYDERAYARRIDYRRDPPVRLAEEDARWLDERLRGQGRRQQSQ
jgi:hypothetical protein